MDNKFDFPQNFLVLLVLVIYFTECIKEPVVAFYRRLKNYPRIKVSYLLASENPLNNIINIKSYQMNPAVGVEDVISLSSD